MSVLNYHTIVFLSTTAIADTEGLGDFDVVSAALGAWVDVELEITATMSLEGVMNEFPAQYLPVGVAGFVCPCALVDSQRCKRDAQSFRLR